MSGIALTATSLGRVTIALSADWQTALETFLNTLSSPSTRRTYKWAVEEAMRADPVVEQSLSAYLRSHLGGNSRRAIPCQRSFHGVGRSLSPPS